MPNSLNDRKMKELHALLIKRQAIQMVLMFLQLAAIVFVFAAALYLAFSLNY